MYAAVFGADRGLSGTGLLALAARRFVVVAPIYGV